MRQWGLSRGMTVPAFLRASGGWLGLRAGQAWRPILPGIVIGIMLVAVGGAQPGPRLMRENGKWVRVIYGNAPSAPKLRSNTHGPVTLESGVSKDFTYVVKVAVAARSEAEARRVI